MHGDINRTFYMGACPLCQDLWHTTSRNKCTAPMGPISPIWEKGDRPKNPFREKGERLKKAKKFREKGEREIILGEGRRGLH